MATIPSPTPDASPDTPSATAPRATYGVNVAHVVGRLVRDPELRYTPQGIAHCRLRVVTNGRSGAEFHDVACWRELARIAAQITAKGVLVHVTGELRTRSWDDATGARRQRTEVVATHLIALGPRGAQGLHGTLPPEAAESDEAA